MKVSGIMPITLCVGLYRLTGIKADLHRDDRYILGAEKIDTLIYFDKYSPTATVTVWSLAGSIEYFAQMHFSLAFNRCDM